jgi:16S rRNA (adenine1518-N6/adenine1519-N6)-dimethyltransferase
MVSILRELRQFSVKPKKSLGQHFLIDRNILKKVVQTAKINEDDVVLEVGPGLGEMTMELCKKAKKVIAIEIDLNLIKILKEKLLKYPNIELIEGNILEIDFLKIYKSEGKPLKVVANLPYNISTPLIFHFIEERKCFSDLTIMVQREVAERIVSPPGSKAYGTLSIFVQLVAIPSIKFFIKRSSFFPPPKVDSALVQIVWRRELWFGKEFEKWFKEVVRGAFNYRRKTLLNALKNSELPLPTDLDEKIRRAGLDPKRRPETLSIKEFIRLAEALRFE